MFERKEHGFSMMQLRRSIYSVPSSSEVDRDLKISQAERPWVELERQEAFEFEFVDEDEAAEANKAEDSETEPPTEPSDP